MAELRSISVEERYDTLEQWVDVSFSSDIRKEGITLRCKSKGIREIHGQPPLHIYPSHEQAYMVKVTAICYVCAFGPPPDRNV